jgi:Protein of unknown function (DUF1592)/Protein of unknown function (DUF1588)/Protein of unknown function (DUF1587)/Protein of unknown function (DUF1595)/Protein of unknown function (DUF1585)
MGMKVRTASVRVVFTQMLRLVTAVYALSSCTGQISGGTLTGPSTPLGNDPPDGKVSACASGAVYAHAPVRRLNRWEYNNAVADLLGDTSRPAADFGAEEEAHGFNNNAEALLMSSELAAKYLIAAEKLSVEAAKKTTEWPWLGCDGAAQVAKEAACTKTFIAGFGLRAFRRPLLEEETKAFEALFASGKEMALTGLDGKPLPAFQSGAALVMQAALVSPEFLYRIEWRPPADKSAAPSSPKPVTGYEMASRLSFLLWGALPDEALYEAAAQGRLATAEDIAAQTERMLRHPNARRMVRQFHLSWLDFDRIGSVGKANTVFPEYSPKLGQTMREETERFIEHVVFNGSARYEELLTAPYTVVDDSLAAVYGFAAPTPGTWAKVDAPERAGLLTQGVLMSIYGHSDQTSPVLRGKLVRESLLCYELRPPPANVSTELPSMTVARTARERFAQHSADKMCFGCHRLMDDIGFGFENFDGIGRFRTTENGQPIDASSTLVNTDNDGAFVGPKGLGQRLVNSKEARACYVTQWFRFAYGRGSVDADACTMERLNEAFEKSDGNILALLQTLTQADAFRFQGDKSP